MPLLSLFMSSTGIFCFVPISQRLIKSGIVPASNGWWLQRLSSPLELAFYGHKKDGLGLQLIADGTDIAWSDTKSPQIPLYPLGDTLPIDSPPATPANEWKADMIESSRTCSPADSFLQSTPINTLYGREYSSFSSDTTLCESCNTLLRQEIPSDHIPSVIRAFALFEAQDRVPDVGFSEFDVAALTNAFSTLKL